MTRSFKHPFWKRIVTVDDDGVHEHRRGRPFASIRWEELDSLSRDGVRSDRGARISLRLSLDRRREFADYASQIWSQRHPERWQRNRERAKRAADWAAYFWLPLFTIGPCIFCYLLLWVLGWPESLQPHLQKIHRLTALGLVWIIGFWIWYGYTTRKATKLQEACKSVQPAGLSNRRISTV
jgi:hypothetical protein